MVKYNIRLLYVDAFNRNRLKNFDRHAEHSTREKGRSGADFSPPAGIGRRVWDYVATSCLFDQTKDKKKGLPNYCLAGLFLWDQQTK